MNKILSENEINNFNKDGAIFLEGKFADLSFKKIFGYYQEGVIVRNRFHTYIEINQINLLNLLKLFFLKFIYFFVFWDQLYSLKHNILNTIIFFTDGESLD